jgi:hypothetical protein
LPARAGSKKKKKHRCALHFFFSRQMSKIVRVHDVDTGRARDLPVPDTTDAEALRAVLGAQRVSVGKGWVAEECADGTSAALGDRVFVSGHRGHARDSRQEEFALGIQRRDQGYPFRPQNDVQPFAFRTDGGR